MNQQGTCTFFKNKITEFVLDHSVLPVAQNIFYDGCFAWCFSSLPTVSRINLICKIYCRKKEKKKPEYINRPRDMQPSNQRENHET